MIVRANIDISSILLRAFFVIHTFIIFYQIILEWTRMSRILVSYVSTFVVLLQVLFV